MAHQSAPTINQSSNLLQSQGSQHHHISRDPAELPTELFRMIVRHVPVKTLWTTRAVSKSWKSLPENDTKNWEHLDVSLFKDRYRQKGTERFLNLSKGLLLSAECPESKVSRASSADMTQVFRDPCLGHILANSSQLKRLSYSTAIPCKSAVGPVLCADKVEVLTRKYASAICTSVKDNLRLFTNLRVLNLERFDGRGIAWPAPGACPALKEVSVKFKQDGAWADNFMKSFINELRLGSLAAAAPNVEKLAITGTSIGLMPTGHLRHFQQPKECAIEINHRLEFVLRFPPSLKKLRLYQRIPNGAPVEDFDPTESSIRLPDLEDLEINVGYYTPDPEQCVWYELLRASGCKLRKLKIDAGWSPVKNRYIPPGHIDGWVYQAVGPLAEDGALSELEELFVRPDGEKWMSSMLLSELAERCPKLRSLTFFDASSFCEETLCNLVEKGHLQYLCVLPKPELNRLASVCRELGVQLVTQQDSWLRKKVGEGLQLTPTQMNHTPG